MPRSPFPNGAIHRAPKRPHHPSASDLDPDGLVSSPPLPNGNHGQVAAAAPSSAGERNGHGPATALPSANARNGEPAPSAAPSASGANGRDARGRFTKGNPGGPGNPFARRLARLRQVLCQRVTEADIETLAEQLLERVRQGDLAATELLFAYTIGKPVAVVDPDRASRGEAAGSRTRRGARGEAGRKFLG